MGLFSVSTGMDAAVCYLREALPGHEVQWFQSMEGLTLRVDGVAHRLGYDSDEVRASISRIVREVLDSERVEEHPDALEYEAAANGRRLC